MHCTAAGLHNSSGSYTERNAGLPVCFEFLLLAFVGATVSIVANSRKAFALLAVTFLLGLGALEAVLVCFLAFNPYGEPLLDPPPQH